MYSQARKNLIYKLASKVAEGLNIKSGSNILIDSDSSNMDLMRSIALECRRLGNYPIVCYEDGYMLFHESKYATKEHLLKRLKYYKILANNSDAIITLRIDSNIDDIARFRCIYNDVIGRIVRKFKIPWIYIDTRYLENASELYECDYKAIAEKYRQILEFLSKAKSIIIESGVDEKMIVELNNDCIFLDDGYLSEQDRKNGWNIINWPTGELSICIEDGNVEGNISVNKGTQVCKINVSNSRVVNCSENQLIGKSICELGIGLNPFVSENVDCEKQLGKMHIGIGNWMHGEGVIGHSDYDICNPRLKVDDVQILEKDTFSI